jgi:hypothetical protein
MMRRTPIPLVLVLWRAALAPEPPSSTGALDAAAENFAYVGCFSHQSQNLVDSWATGEAFGGLTPSQCAAHARSRGATWFALEYPQGYTNVGAAGCGIGGVYDSEGELGAERCLFRVHDGPAPLGGEGAMAVYALPGSPRPTSRSNPPPGGETPATRDACATGFDADAHRRRGANDQARALAAAADASSLAAAARAFARVRRRAAPRFWHHAGVGPAVTGPLLRVTSIETPAASPSAPDHPPGLETPRAAAEVSWGRASAAVGASAAVPGLRMDLPRMRSTFSCAALFAADADAAGADAAGADAAGADAAGREEAERARSPAGTSEPLPHGAIAPPPRRPTPEQLVGLTMGGDVPVMYQYFGARGTASATGTATRVPVWSVDLVEAQRARAARGDPGLQSKYGAEATADVLAAIASSHGRAAIVGRRGLVIGSQHPWVEAALLAGGAAHVTTVEYGRIVSEHPALSAVTPAALAARILKSPRSAGGTTTKPQKPQKTQNPGLGEADFAFSFSSLEHAGLGRYGDPLNPFGDLEAVARVWCLLRPGGTFFLAVPVGWEHVNFNGHRVYGPRRLPLLLSAGWELLEVIGRHSVDQLRPDDWRDFSAYRHPIMVLRKA